MNEIYVHDSMFPIENPLRDIYIYSPCTGVHKIIPIDNGVGV